jgi:hypothetical protein
MLVIDLRGELPEHPTKKYKTRSTDRIRNVVLHNSATKDGGAFSFARYHVQKNNWPGIGYHYVILTDGTIQWCHDLNVISYHVGSSNGHAVGICLVGDFRFGNKPTKKQWKSALWLCNDLKNKLALKTEEFKGHQEMPGYSWKVCPGFSMDQFRSELAVSDKAIFKFGDKQYEGKYIDGKAMIPAREFAQDLGLKVHWQGENEPILIEGKNDQFNRLKALINKYADIQEQKLKLVGNYIELQRDFIKKMKEL